MGLVGEAKRGWGPRSLPFLVFFAEMVLIQNRLIPGFFPDIDVVLDYFVPFVLFVVPPAKVIIDAELNPSELKSSLIPLNLTLSKSEIIFL